MKSLAAGEADDYDAPPQYEAPPASLHLSPAHISPSESINAALSAFSSLTPADVGDVLRPHLSFIFAHLTSASLQSLVSAAEVRQRWRQLPRPLIEHILPFLPPHTYLALCAVSRHYRSISHAVQWQRLQHIQLTGRLDDKLNQHGLSLLRKSLPQCGELSLRSFPLAPILLLSLDRFNLRSLYLTHCSIASSAAGTDTWLALGSSSCLRRLQRLHLNAVSGFDDESLFQLVVNDGKNPSMSWTSLHLT